jgi:hypothetical protein
MTFREILGLTLITAALVLIPVAWTFNRMLWFAAFAMFVVGIALFLTDRVSRRMSKAEAGGASGSGSSGHAVPTDIHNYTGWRSGGRSETMDHSSTAGDGGD